MSIVNPNPLPSRVDGGAEWPRGRVKCSGMKSIVDPVGEPGDKPNSLARTLGLSGSNASAEANRAYVSVERYHGHRSE